MKSATRTDWVKRISDFHPIRRGFAKTPELTVISSHTTRQNLIEKPLQNGGYPFSLKILST